MSSTVILTSKKIDIQKEKSTMPRVMVESPLAGDYIRNIEYARLASRHSLMMNGESPMAFHLIYGKSLRDKDETEREIGIKRSFNWHSYAEKKVFYLDRGLSNGMIMGYLDAKEKGISTEFRIISNNIQMKDFISQFNNRKLSINDIKNLGKTLQKIIESNKKMGLNNNGDVTSYREECAVVIKLLNDINTPGDLNTGQIINCLAMRESLLERGESPLVLEEFYNQFLMNQDEFQYKEKRMLKDASQSWLQVAKEIIIFNNPLEKKEARENERTYSDAIFKDIDIINGLMSEQYSIREKSLNTTEEDDYSIPILW